MIKDISNKFNLIAIIASFILSLLAFVYFCDIRILNPSFNKWLMPGDSETYWLNWLFYQQSTIFQIPIFKNYSYGMELSSTIALNDSLPIMALIFKLIQGILPPNSQYFGVWILSCFFLQSFFAMKLLKNFSNDIFLIILFSIFFLIAPIFLWRLWGHYSLMAHWLILASLNIYFDKEFNYIRWLVIFFFSYLISAYIAVMMFIIFLTDLIKRKVTKEIDYKKFGIILSIFFFSSLACLYIVGYIEPGTKLSTSGFGTYKANLLTFFDSNDLWSNIIKDISSIEGEHEGFAFLGSGVILLSFISIFYIALTKFKLRLLSTVELKYISIVSTLLFVLALSNNMHIADVHIINLDLPKFIEKSFGIIRASGRMVWIPFYIIYLLLFIIIDSFHNKRVCKILLIFALLIGVLDINKISNLFRLKTGDIDVNYKKVYSGPQHRDQYYYWNLQWNSPMQSEEWKEFPKIYKKINYVYPKNRPDNYFILALYAAKNNMSVNFGSFSRVKKKKVIEVVKELKTVINNNDYDLDTLYYFNDDVAWEIALRNKKENDLVKKIDGLRVVAPEYYNMKEK